MTPIHQDFIYKLSRLEISDDDKIFWIEKLLNAPVEAWETFFGLVQTFPEDLYWLRSIYYRKQGAIQKNDRMLWEAIVKEEENMSEVSESPHPNISEALPEKGKFHSSVRQLLPFRRRPGSETRENNVEHKAWITDEENRVGVLSGISDRAKRIGGAFVLTTMLASGGGQLVDLGSWGGVPAAEAGQSSQRKRGTAAERQHSVKGERMSAETEKLLRESDAYLKLLKRMQEAERTMKNHWSCADITRKLEGI